MLKLRKKIISLALIGMLSTSCANKDNKDVYVPVDPIDGNLFINEEEILYNGSTEYIEEEKEYEVKRVHYARLINDTNVFDEESNIIGTAAYNTKYEIVSSDEDYYKVKYYNKVGYISKTDATMYIQKEVNNDIIEHVYNTDSITINIPSDLSPSNKEMKVSIEPNSLIDVYIDKDDELFVSVNGFTGYINKDNLSDLSDDFVSVDISEQKLTFYVDNQVDLIAPVVTGGKGHETPQGVFNIYEQTKNRYLVGPTWRSYVNYMSKFYDGCGLHDAEKITDKYGKYHGWRDKEEFGGYTYLKNGSHGCVNMLNSDAEYVCERINSDTNVIVKK